MGSINRFILMLVMALVSACATSPRGNDGSTGMGISALSTQQRNQYELSLERMKAGEFGIAKKMLLTLMNEEPDIFELPLNAALCDYHTGNLDAAESRVIPLQNAGNAEPYANNLLGLIALRKGEFAEAKTYFNKAISKKADYANALYNMALLHDVYWQDLAAALPYYQKYLALVPDDLDTRGWADQIASTLASEN